MPELPEVETIVRDLRGPLVGQVCKRVAVLRPKVIARPTPEEFAPLLENRKILDLRRRGKYILAELSGGWVLVLHLRMTGQLVYHEGGQRPEVRSQKQEGGDRMPSDFRPLASEIFPKHTHLVFYLDRGVLRFTDLRQFGRVSLVPEQELGDLPGLRDLGIEPLNAEFTAEGFADSLNRSRRMIKPLLLDQTFLAGLGNIYTDEALHRAGVHPERPAGGLEAREAHALYRTIREVLTDGLTFGGTSVQHYVDGSGKPGRFQELLRVYGKQGVPCPACGTPVERIRCGGRGTHYCPTCQVGGGK